MADLTRRAEAARRAADALLRAAGGRAVMLRVPAPASAAADGVSTTLSELGLSVPTFADVELGPAAFRRSQPVVDATTGTARWELLVSAAAVARAAGTHDVGACFAMFAAAEGIVVDGALLLIAGVSSSDMTGSPYVFRLQLERAAQRQR